MDGWRKFGHFATGSEICGVSAKPFRLSGPAPLNRNFDSEV